MRKSEPGFSDSTMHAGGSIPGAEGLAAFATHVPERLAIPVLIAVPHAGREYPSSLVNRMRHPAEAAPRLEDRYVDLVARQVAAATGATLLVAHAPRAMIDLNRSPEDVDWEMIAPPRSGFARARTAAGRRSRSGLGLVPRRLPGLGELWRQRLPASDLEQRIEQVHTPYHLALSQGLETLRDRWGGALLLDFHSMPPLGLKTGSDAAADFVLGDRFGAACDSHLVASALDYLGRAGARAAHNRPYAGGYVLDRHAAPVRGISAMQIEICRAIYLDRNLREPSPGLADTASLLIGLVRHLAEELARGTQVFSQAAE